jgi:uncharacterized oligopeptide transporter (OPT) family protein
LTGSAATLKIDIRMNNRAELTIRGIIIGVVITLVFTAANVYAGLKAASLSRHRFLRP